MSLLRWARRAWLDHVAAWYVMFNRRERAIGHYRRILEVEPGNALALASIGYQQAQIGRKREALATFDRLVQVAPNDAEAHFNRGFLQQELNDPDGAMAAFHRVLEINPKHDRALYGLALVLIGKRQLAEAVPYLKRNTRAQPMSPYGWYQLTRVEHELGHLEEAQAALDQVSRFEPKVARQLERETGLRARS